MSYQSNGDRNDRPQNVDHSRHFARAPRTDSQKLERVEAPSAAFTIRLDALGDFMSFVVVPGEGVGLSRHHSL
jgi:hypothetical protein